MRNTPERNASIRNRTITARVNRWLLAGVLLAGLIVIPVDAGAQDVAAEASALVSSINTMIADGKTPAEISSQIAALLDQVKAYGDDVRNEIFALALTLADAQTRALLAPQVILAILPPGETDPEKIAAAVIPVINQIPPIPPEQGDREGAAAALMVALSSMLPVDQLPGVMNAVFAGATESASSMVPAMAAGVLIGAGANSGPAVDAILGALGDNQDLVDSVNNALENPQQFVSPELNQAFEDNPPPPIPTPPADTGDGVSTIINDPAPIVTEEGEDETPAPPAPPPPPPPAPLYPGQAG